MIPLCLTLKNFMSYREPVEVNFAPIRTACLSGDNGAGKSALLTAMTWALWGESPSHAADEDLIAQGESEMSVDFAFGLGDQRYRVLRSRARKGKSTTGRLTFQVHDTDAGWRDISGDSSRHTQSLITARLRMDYDTFINSAFLRQGHADEFTTKTPTERKDVLAKILGLAEYDRLADRAREHVRDLEAERKALMLRIQELDSRVARKDELQQQLAEVQAFLATARATLATAQADVDRTRLILAGMEKDERALENARARAAQDEVEISKGERLIGGLQANLARYQETLAQRESILANYARLQSLRAREGELTDLAHRHHEAQGEITRLERLIDAARNALVNEGEMFKRSIAEQTRLAATRAVVEPQLAEIRGQLAAFAIQDAESQAARQQREGLQQQVAQWQGANEKLKEEADASSTRLKVLDESIAAAEAGHRRGQAPCPLCGALMASGVGDRVRADYQQEIESRRGQWRANKRQIDAAQAQIAALDRRIAALDEKLKGRRMAEKRETGLDGNLQVAQDAERRRQREEASLQEVLARIAASAFAEDARAALQAAQAAQTALAYDPQAHRKVTAEARDLAGYEQRHADLRSAEEKLDADTARLAHERETLAAHRARLAGERAEEARLALALAGLAALRRQATDQAALVQAQQARADRLSREEGALARQLEQVAEDETERAAKAAAQVQVTTDKGVYDELARAFGKSGVQAMIIEQVVPELADDANALLGRMTDNRMRMVFETQRQAKTRDSTIETLDIKITDGAGVARKYEMFSGGEAFRINFAVRIALSKLLARRAGAQLQTLIIDEGFGTQDVQGRERLVQAIRSIQEDFEKILVITHLDELKDEFPSRIDVVKTPRGSLATVS